MAILGVLGLILYLVGWIWIIILGFKTGEALWGILNIVFQPITGLIFCIVKKIGWLQLAMMIVGIGLASFGLAPMIANQMDAMQKM